MGILLPSLSSSMGIAPCCFGVVPEGSERKAEAMEFMAAM